MGNAAGSFNGWTFQLAYCLLVFFKSIKEIKTIKFEGKKEDIEIITNDGKLTYIQCKSVLLLDDNRNWKSKLQLALESLLENNNADFLCYASNIYNPLNSSYASFYDKKYGIWSYAQLPEKDKETIKLLCDLIPTDKLSISYMDFFGSDEQTKLAVVKEAIDSFCYPILSSVRYSDEILNAYIKKFSLNALDGKPLDKSSFVMPLILALVRYCDDEIAVKKLFGTKYSYLDLKDIYEQCIYIHFDEFEFVNKFMADYDDYNISEDKTVEDFVLEKGNNYIDDFLEIDLSLREPITKLFIYKLLNTRNKIKIIKGRANLC